MLEVFKDFVKDSLSIKWAFINSFKMNFIGYSYTLDLETNFFSSLSIIITRWLFFGIEEAVDLFKMHVLCAVNLEFGASNF